MTRRCKPGQRCKVIGGVLNRGAIVVVMRPYFGESINGASWPIPVFPWVVTSLGRPLDSAEIPSGRRMPPAMTIVVDDCELEPLRDGDDGLYEAESARRPVLAMRPVLANVGGGR